MPKVRFVVHFPGAREVFLTGDFAGWNPRARRMRRSPGEKDVFATWLRLRRGRYQFKYVVDGEWYCDPQAPRVRTEEGFENSVIEV
jgi:1,4-alpha-glucan branching enzyme